VPPAGRSTRPSLATTTTSVPTWRAPLRGLPTTQLIAEARPHPTVKVEPAAPYGGRVILAGRATRVPQAAVTNGIQRTTTVTPIGPLGWASASDLASWRSPKLHGMQGVKLAPRQRPPVRARPAGRARPHDDYQCHTDQGGCRLITNGPPPKFHGTRDILTPQARPTRWAGLSGKPKERTPSRTATNGSRAVAPGGVGGGRWCSTATPSAGSRIRPRVRSR
jgi:hypothetical protein